MAAVTPIFTKGMISMFYDNLKGIKINALGDSYLEGDKLERQYTWPRLMAEKYGMEFTNHGKNGSTMSDFVDTNKPMVVRYVDLPDNEPDLVFLEGGRNDYNKCVPIGDLHSTDTKTFSGAARFLITKLSEKYPNAPLLCMTNWEVGGKPNAAGHMCSDYGRAFMAVCDDMGVPYINGIDQDEVGVYMTDPEFRLKYCQHANDISHFNAEGMKRILPMFEKRFSEMLSD